MEQKKIHRFFQGQSSPDEAFQVWNWLNSHRSEPEVLNLIRSYWQENEQTDWNAEESWENFRQKLENSGQFKLGKTSINPPKHTVNKSWFFKAAAVLLFLITFGYIIHQFSNSLDKQGLTPVETAYIEKTTEKGQKLTVFLKDGSKVILNSQSKLKYPPYFDDSIRLVYLSGEAFFEVAENEKVPFKVITETAETTVLGTRFNINCHQNNQSIISLVSGSVNVKLTNPTQSKSQIVTLSPGQAAIVDSRLNDLQVTEFNYEETALWTEGILYFQKASFNQMISKLEKWYGVEFEIIGEDKIDGKHFSGKFDNENLNNVLQSISFSKNFSYEITDKRVILNFK